MIMNDQYFYVEFNFPGNMPDTKSIKVKVILTKEKMRTAFSFVKHLESGLSTTKLENAEDDSKGINND